MLAVGDGTVVTVHYTLRDPDGSVVRTTRGRAPVRYLHGSAGLPPGIARALAGLRAGESVRVVLGPEDGYGDRKTPGPEVVPRRELPRSLHLEVGNALALARPGRPPVQVWVTRIRGSRVWLDADHPLAGRTLAVEAEVVEVRLATAEEVERGSVDPEPVRRD